MQTSLIFVLAFGVAIMPHASRIPLLLSSSVAPHLTGVAATNGDERGTRLVAIVR